jgi:hypothetical protein
MYDKVSYARWYAKNKENKKLSSRKWEQENPDKVRAYRSSKLVRDKNKQAVRDLSCKWYKQIDAIKLHYGCQNDLCPLKSIGYVSDELDFHHIDPKSKEFTISSLKNRLPSLVASEINKCCVLCANCHRRHHSGVLLEIINHCFVNDKLTPIFDYLP